MKKIAIVVLLIVFCVVFLTGCSKKEKEEKKADNTIKIILYKTGTEEIIREINIVNTEAINKLNEYLASIEPLKEEEMVNLVLPQEISIIYNDNVSELLQMYPTHQHLLINDTARRIVSLFGGNG